MENGWNKYQKGRVQFRGPEARIKKEGSIFLNRVATEMFFANAPKVILYYDADGHRIGLQPTDGNEPYARRVRMVAAKDKNGNRVARLGSRIAAKPFLAEFDIPMEKICKVDFEKETGLVIIDLKGAKPCRRSRRVASSKKSSKR